MIPSVDIGLPLTLDPAAIAALRRRVAWRILPLVILLYLAAYLDRANVGFAKLRMAQDLGFSEEVFGLGIGVFFIGYLTLEIPGALLVERWSARKWFARILITWGLLSAATAFVQTPPQFYLSRFLLGVAEAGFFPGIIVYFTHWFPMKERARAMSGFIVAIPLSLALGAPLSGALLNVNWLGWKGWQWLFVVEGLPAVLLGDGRQVFAMLPPFLGVVARRSGGRVRTGAERLLGAGLFAGAIGSQALGFSRAAVAPRSVTAVVAARAGAHGKQAHAGQSKN